MQLRSLWARVLPALPVAMLIAGLTVQVGYAVHLAQGLWFFGDDWDFLLRRGLTDDAERSMWEPHNEHWSTVPIVLFRLVFAGVGLQHFLPYALLPIAAHVATWSVLYVVLRRVGVTAWPSAVSVWIGSFLAAGTGAQNVLWAFQIGFLGSAAFGVLGLLCAHGRTGWRLVATWVALVLSLASSGIGMIFVGWVVLLAFLRDGLARAVAVGSVPSVVFAVWLGVAPGHVEPQGRDLDTLPTHLFQGLDAIWSQTLGMTGAGTLVLVGLAGMVFLRPQPRESFALTASGLAALVAAFAIFAFARSGLGDDSTTRSRYLYFGLLFCLPAVTLVVEEASRRLVVRPAAAPVGAAVVMVLASALGFSHQIQWADDRADKIGDEPEEVAAAAQLIDDREPLLTDFVSGEHNPDITVANLAPVSDQFRAVRVSPGTMLEVRSKLQVTVLAGGPPTSGRCVKRDVDGGNRNIVFVVPAQGVSLSVETEANDDIETSLIDGPRESDQTDWVIPPQGFVTVTSRASGLAVRVELPEGPATICRRVSASARAVNS